MNILGISAYYHDAAAAILQDGKLVACAQEERFSRRKHDPSLPERAIQYCLSAANIQPSDLDYVVFYEKPLRKFERLLSTQIATFPKSIQVFPRAMFTWLSNKLWMRTAICKAVRVPPERVLFTEHHQSHAASAFFCSPFSEAAVLVMDGVGEWATTTLYHGKTDPKTGTSHLQPLAEIRYPHSLGLLYSAFTAYLGFEVNDGEYKVMGMAPYGQPRYLEALRTLLKPEADGSYSLNLDYFCYHYHPDKSFTHKLEQLLGPARKPGTRFVTPLTGQAPEETPASPAELEENQRFADIAASVQRLTEETMLSLVAALARRTGSQNLCMAGGVALNSVANGRIVREGPFENVFIQPAAGDAGGALGAALFAQYAVLKQPRILGIPSSPTPDGRRGASPTAAADTPSATPSATPSPASPQAPAFVMDRTDFGQSLSEAEVERFLKDCRIPYERCDDEAQLLQTVAALLAEGHVIGWAQGRFEWGPRALGNRSILADPRSASMKDRVNRKVKFREPFRPFAPAILSERANEYYELERFGGLGDPSRFMLLTAQVRPEHRQAVAATTHEDGSSRLQRVEKALNPRFYGLIEQFAQRTGVPVLLNTSFNLKGEPIVNSPLEAYATFQRSELDVLVLDRFIVRRKAETA